MWRTSSWIALLALILLPARLSRAADDLETDATWKELSDNGRSFVFGRIEGRFDGTEYRGRKLRVRHEESGKEHLIPVGPGLGFFEAVLPVGLYTFLAIEAVYFPPDKSLKLNRFRPVRQRYFLQPIPGVGLPTFPVIAERPTYLGTIRSGVGGDRLVYEGHALELVDEFERALERLQSSHRLLFASLAEADIEPVRYFFLKPIAVPPPLEVANVGDPLSQARDYIQEGKFEQALSWLQTFMPTNDAERSEVRLLVGETYLADRRYDDAIEELGEVLVDEPGNMRALRLLARAHAFDGNREDAIGLYRGLAESVADDAEANLHLGYDYALAANEASAEQAFEAAFRVNFDYLLHDLTPYALALKAESAEYVPPKIIDGAVKLPSTLRSRRGSRGTMGLLLDHDGRIVAVHVTPDAGSWATGMLMSVIRARFHPAQLNGVAIPCLIIVGEGSELQLAQ